MVGLLGLADLPLEPDDLHAVFAQRAIHMSASMHALLCPFEEDLDEVGVNPHIMRLQDFYLGVAHGQRLGSGVDAFDQNTIEEQKWHDDNPPVSETRRHSQAICDKWLGSA
jgi:hypothetical protein